MGANLFLLKFNSSQMISLKTKNFKIRHFESESWEATLIFAATQKSGRQTP